MENGFVKAYCSKSGQYFGMKIESVSGSQKVVDFYDIDAEKAKALASTVDISNLKTADNLRSCFQCGSRTVGKCNCAKREYRCSTGLGYRYQCIYCSDLHIFSCEEGAEICDDSRIGLTVRLTQGQEVVISAAGPGALEHILVGTGWDIARSGENSMDVDSSVFVMNNSDRIGELVYYGEKKHASGCVVHMGDNLTGGRYTSDSDDSENINVYLNKVPRNRDVLFFVLNIYNCDSKNQTFRDVHNMYIRLTNAKTHQLLVEYRVDADLRDKTGLIIGKTQRRDGKWYFKAIGKGVYVRTVAELKDFCQD